MVKLQESQGQFTIAVPKLMVKSKRWKKGQELIWSFNKDGYLELREV